MSAPEHALSSPAPGFAAPEQVYPVPEESQTEVSPIAATPPSGPARVSEGQAPNAPRQMTVSELSSTLQVKVRRAQSAEKRSESELSRARQELESAAIGFREDLEKFRAAERVLDKKRRRLEQLLVTAKRVEENRDAVRSARVGLEALKDYYQLLPRVPLS